MEFWSFLFFGGVVRDAGFGNEREEGTASIRSMPVLIKYHVSPDVLSLYRSDLNERVINHADSCDVNHPIESAQVLCLLCNVSSNPCLKLSMLARLQLTHMFLVITAVT